MLRELKTFLVVTRSGSFALAGAKIGLTQSAVSAQMQRLEQALGLQLFERTGRSAQLSAAGRAAIAKAEQILSLFEGMGADAVEAVARTTLRLGAIATAQTSLLPTALRIFQQKHPQVAVRIIPGPSVQLLSHVDSGELDAAILVEPPFVLPGELRWRTLVRERFALVVPREVKGEEWKVMLREHRFVQYDRGSFGGRLVERFLRRHQLTPQDAAELDEPAAIARMVGEGLGVALLPVSPDLLKEKVRIIELGRHVFHRHVGIVTRVESSQEALAPFVDALVAAGRELRPVRGRTKHTAS